MRSTEPWTDRGTEIKRRSVLRRGALAVGGLVVGGVGIATGEADHGHPVPGKYPPNPNVDFSRVFLFGVPEGNAPTGDWIQHVVGFNPPGSGKQSVKRFIDRHEMAVQIGGKSVENPKQYWLAALDPDGNWIGVWPHTTPPKNPGLIDYSIRINFLGHEFPIAGSYTVTEGADEAN